MRMDFEDFKSAISGRSGMKPRLAAYADLKSVAGVDLRSVISEAVSSAFNGRQPYAFEDDDPCSNITEIAVECFEEGAYAQQYEACLRAIHAKTIAKNVVQFPADQPDRIARDAKRDATIDEPVATASGPTPKKTAAEKASLTAGQSSEAIFSDGPLWDEAQNAVEKITAMQKPDRQSSGFSGGDILLVPRLLPPPPDKANGEKYGAWLEGNPHHPMAFAFKPDLDADRSFDDMVEMQSEFYADPDSAILTYGARKPVSPAAGDADAIALFHAARDLGVQGTTLDQALKDLRASVLRYLAEFEPSTMETLGAMGFDIRAHHQLLHVIASARDIEEHFLEDAPESASQGRQPDLRGSISANDRLDGRYMLDRAVILHFMSGVALSTGMRSALIELRHAQLCRHEGRDVLSSEFDARFDFDMFQPLENFFEDEPACVDEGLYPG